MADRQTHCLNAGTSFFMPNDVMVINDAIEEPATKVEDALGLLKELLDETDLPTVPKRSAKRHTVRITEMTHVEFRAHKARRQAERRAKLKACKWAGNITFDATSTRDALADAALMILATGSDGTDTILSCLAEIFHEQAGVSQTIQTWAKSGKLAPKLIHVVGKAI